MLVGDEKEDNYIQRKVTDYNDKQKGRGDEWEKQWYADREARFEPRFDELFEKYAKMSPKGKDAKYLLIFHTTYTEPGFNVGVARRPARINAEVAIVDAADELKLIALFTIENAPGAGAGGYDYDSGYRIQEAYAKSGKELGKLITKMNK